jgi:sugar phosphate isomerase/epimerase
LNAYAKKKNIFLGVENRYYLSEIPSFEEVAKILAHFGNSNIFYWHDFGHAQIFQNLGVCKQSDYLQAGGQRLIGVHIHDVKGFQDHLPLGKGAIDYLRYKSIIQDPKVLKVLEIHGPASIDEIVESKKQIEKIIADPRC